MEKDLKDFIDKRINSNYYKLRNDKNWQEANEKYNISYEKLHRKLPKELQEELDNVIDLKNNLMYHESIFGYRIGISETIRLCIF